MIRTAAIAAARCSKVRVISRSPIWSISIVNKPSRTYCQSIISKIDISLIVCRQSAGIRAACAFDRRGRDPICAPCRGASSKAGLTRGPVQEGSPGRSVRHASCSWTGRKARPSCGVFASRRASRLRQFSAGPSRAGSRQEAKLSHGEEVRGQPRTLRGASSSKKKRIRKIFGNIHEVVRDAEPDRGSARELRAVPPLATAGRLCLGPREDAALGLPDPRFRRHRRARLRPLRARRPQIRHRRVPPARHDLCGADARHAAPDRVRGRSRYRDPLRARYQGAGRLHGRHAADDEERHVHRQRHRARHRQPDAPLAGRAVRP